MSHDELPPPAPPTNVRWTVFSLACLTSGLLYLHRYTFGFIKPLLQAELGLSNTELGKIDFAFSLTYTVFQFPLAVLADLFGVHLILPCLFLVWCGGLGLMCWGPSASWIWYSQAVLGTGQSAVYPCLNRIGRMWFPPPVQTVMQGAVGILSGRLGAASTSLVFAWLLLGVCGLSWRTAVLLLIAVGAAPMAIFAVVFRNTPREHSGVNEAEARLIEGPLSAASGQRPPAMTLRQMFQAMSPRSIRNLLFLSAQSTLSTIADNVFSNWIPLFLFQVHHLDFKRMGIYSMLPLLGGAAAGLVGGGLNDYLIAKTGNRRWSRVAVAFFGKAMAAVLLVAALSSYQNPQAFCIFLFFVKFFGDWSLTTSWGVIAEIGGRATASVFAFNNSIASIGQILAPILFGFVSQHYGWPAVFVTVAATYLLCAVSWFAIDCTIPVLREPVAEA